MCMFANRAVYQRYLAKVITEGTFEPGESITVGKQT